MKSTIDLQNDAICTDMIHSSTMCEKICYTIIPKKDSSLVNTHFASEGILLMKEVFSLLMLVFQKSYVY